MLHVDLVAAERCIRLAADACELLPELILVVGDLHSPASAAVERLEYDRHPELPGHDDDLIDVGDHAVGPRNGGYMQRLGDLLGPRFVADGPQGRARRADERDAVLFAQGRKVWVFREKSVTGVDGVRLPSQRRADDRLDVEVALRRLGRADLDRFVDMGQVLHIPIRLGIDGNGLKPHLPSRSENPYDDFSAVRDQNSLHRARLYACFQAQVKVHDSVEDFRRLPAPPPKGKQDLHRGSKRPGS
ncbi:MAG: hypothetical protein BWZ01_03044 [Deltaproteobacteria bacterium ADurb.BinA179]|nr:MAG: hypothetical protein BWZ01_03044 [Deltaproteobacteria bacterium ADurb.BinA179]